MCVCVYMRAYVRAYVRACTWEMLSFGAKIEITTRKE